MDGRVQEPIINYLKENHGVRYVDAITEPGPCKILAENRDRQSVDSILARLKISVEKHGSKLIAVSGHYDCAGNPCGEAEQKQQVDECVKFLSPLYPDIEIIRLWIDSSWKVFEI